MEKKVICINAGNLFIPSIKYGIQKLEEGRIYTVRGEGVYNKGYGYLLEGIHNPSTIEGTEACYAASRFIPLSEKDETESILAEKEFA